MTSLSVNINKVATLRNSRGGDTPNLLKVAKDLQEYGAQGITIHPRPDQRHIRYKDALDLPQILKDLSAARNMNLEWNIPPDLRRFAIESLESMVTDAFREQNIGVDPEELGGETLIFGGELDVSHAYDINAATEWFNQMLDVDRKIRTRIARSIGLSLLQSALIKDMGQQKQEQEPEELQEVYKRWRRLVL